MTIIERIKNIFLGAAPRVPVATMPVGFVRNTDFDAVLLAEVYGDLPEIIRASDGKAYVYFEKITDEQLTIVRQMGFEPVLHKSHKYIPARDVYRVRVHHDMPSYALKTVTKAAALSYGDVDKQKMNPEYLRYIANYNVKSK